MDSCLGKERAEEAKFVADVASWVVGENAVEPVEVAVVRGREASVPWDVEPVVEEGFVAAAGTAVELELVVLMVKEEWRWQVPLEHFEFALE